MNDSQLIHVADTLLAQLEQDYLDTLQHDKTDKEQEHPIEDYHHLS